MSIVTLTGNWVSIGGAGIVINQSTSFIVIGGRKYPYVQIGNQLWLAENLDYKFEYEGSTLPIGQSGNPTTPAAWYYNNEETTYGVNGNKYGLLYNWYAVNYIETNKSTLLPDGWHVPTLSEWDTLATACGGSASCGTKLKSATGWNSGNGTDDFGFTAFPAGCRDSADGFRSSGVVAYFWTFTEYGSARAYDRELTKNATLSSSYWSKLCGYSLRLVKDAQ